MNLQTKNHDTLGVNDYLFPFMFQSFICLISFILCLCYPKDVENEKDSLVNIKKIVKNDNWQSNPNPQSDRLNNIEIKFTVSSNTASNRNSLILFDNNENENVKAENSKPCDVSINNLETYSENEKHGQSNNINVIIDHDEYIEDFSVRLGEVASKKNRSEKLKNEANKSIINSSNLQTNENFERADNLLTANNNSILKSNDVDFKKIVDEDLVIEYNQLGNEDNEKKENNDKIEIINNNGNHIIKTNENHEVDELHEKSKHKKSNEKKVDLSIENNNTTIDQDSRFLGKESSWLNTKSYAISTIYTSIKSSENIFMLTFLLYVYTNYNNNEIAFIIKILMIFTLINAIGVLIMYCIFKKLVSIREEFISINTKVIRIFTILAILFTTSFFLIVSTLIGLEKSQIELLIFPVYAFRHYSSLITFDIYFMLTEKIQDLSQIRKIRLFEIFISKPIISILACISCSVFTNYIASYKDYVLLSLGGVSVLILILSYILISLIRN